tara:strand:+ start:1889 stop:2086 length:198 start_codon:yes stop_codon:yes gene_type:complete
MDSEEQLDKIIGLLRNLLLRQATPVGNDIKYWKCACGMENINLASDPMVCIICERQEQLRIEAEK